MKQTELHLSEADRLALHAFRSMGVHLAREVSRAHVLMTLDGGVADATICRVLGLGRTALWRTHAGTGRAVADRGPQLARAIEAGSAGAMTPPRP